MADETDLARVDILMVTERLRRRHHIARQVFQPGIIPVAGGCARAPLIKIKIGDAVSAEVVGPMTARTSFWAGAMNENEDRMRPFRRGYRQRATQSDIPIMKCDFFLSIRTHALRLNNSRVAFLPFEACDFSLLIPNKSDARLHREHHAV